MRIIGKFAFFMPVILLFMCSNTYGLPSLKMPVYGNWCGPGHPKDEVMKMPTHNHPAPISELDWGCQQHDYGYVKKGDSWPAGASSEVDKKLARIAADILTREKQWRYVPKPTKADSQHDIIADKYKKNNDSPLSAHEYVVAAAICQWFSAEQYLAVILDTFRGDFRAILKLSSPEGAALLVAAPAALTKTFLDEFSKNASPEQKIVLQAASKGIETSIKVTFLVADISDDGIDKIYSIAEGPTGSFIKTMGMIISDSGTFFWDVGKGGVKGSWKVVNTIGEETANIGEATLKLADNLAIQSTKAAIEKTADIPEEGANIVNKVIIRPAKKAVKFIKSLF